MEGSVNEDGVRPLGVEAVDGLLPPMLGAVVPDPEHAAGRLVGFPAHHFTHEACHGRNAVLRFTTSEDLGTMDIPSGQIDPGTLTRIFIFNPGGAMRSGIQSRMFPAASLNAGLFIRGNNIVVGPQRGSLPNALVKIEDGPALSANLGSPGKIQLRCCQERRASLLSSRRRVALLITATSLVK